MSGGIFFEETHNNLFSMRYRVERVLFQGQSSFQRVEIIKTEELGKMLLNDGMVMVTEKDEFIYHDMITHVPLFTHPRPRRVLIIGGGDGGAAREVVRHSTVELCTVVEIDAMVVEACKEHLPQMSHSYDHPRVELKVTDGVDYVRKATEKFDVVIVDSTDPIGPSQPLFGSDFYQDVYRCLGANGMVVSQGESVFYNQKTQLGLLSTLQQIFPVTALYNYQNIVYPMPPWSFTFASKGLHPIHNFDPARVRASELKFQYYSEEIHRAVFALPSFQRELVSQYLSAPQGNRP